MMWVGVGISLVAFFAAMIYLFRLARAHLDDDAAAAAVALLATYPFAFFFSAAYTESLFLLTIVAACYHFERGELWKAGLWGLAAGLTRPNGCLLSIVLALMALRAPAGLTPRFYLSEWRTLAVRMAAAAAPGIGMLIYSTYIYFLTGNPLQWAAQNAAWGRVYRGLDTLVGDRIQYIQHNGLYDYASTQWLDMIQTIAVLFVLGSVWPVYRRFGATLRRVDRRQRVAAAHDGGAAVDGTSDVGHLPDVSLARRRRPRESPLGLAHRLRHVAGPFCGGVLHLETVVLIHRSPIEAAILSQIPP